LIKKKRPRKTSVSKQPNSLVTTSEKIIAGIWQELLSVDDVSRGDDFFELGGYSLLTLKLYARIKDIFDVTLPLSQIFISPVLSSFSEAVDQRTIRSNLLVPLKKQNNSETPLFLIHPAGGTIFCYASLANQLPEDWAVYAIQSPEIAGVRQADYDLDELCQQYVSIITAVNPTGSIRLGGWSLGGKIAFCMAELFEEQNRHIEWVALLDSGYATDYFDSFEEFLASIFLHLNTEDLVIDTTLLEKLRCVQQAAALEDDLNRTLQNDPKWLLHHGIDQETLAFLRTQYQIQRSHAELDRSFNPGIIKAPLHIVWASESLKAKGEEPPIDWLSLTSNKPQSSQIILQGRHTNVITKRENITAIVSILVNYEAK
jgi:thioesterase domain-containing protein